MSSRIVGPAIRAPERGDNMTLHTRTLCHHAQDSFPLPESYEIEVGTRSRPADGLNGCYVNHTIRNGVHNIRNCIDYRYHKYLTNEYLLVLYDTPTDVKMLVLVCSASNPKYIRYWRPKIVQGASVSDLLRMSPEMYTIVRGRRYNVGVGIDTNGDPTTAHMWPTDPAEFTPQHIHGALDAFRAINRSVICMNVRRYDGFCEGYTIRYGVDPGYVTVRLNRVNTYGARNEVWGVHLSTEHYVYAPSEYDKDWYYSIDTIEWCGHKYHVALSSSDRNPRVYLVEDTLCTRIAEYNPAVKFDAVLDPGMVYWSDSMSVRCYYDGESSTVAHIFGLQYNDNTNNIIIDEDPQITGAISILMRDHGKIVPTSTPVQMVHGSLKFGVAFFMVKPLHSGRLDYYCKNIRQSRLRDADCRETYFELIPRDIVNLVREYLAGAACWSCVKND